MTNQDPFRLDGKVALVTGAGRGIGRAIALAMADAGADVGLVARSRSELDEVAGGIRSRQRRAAVVVADLRVTSNARPVVDQIVAELGAIDVLVNNAGGASPAPFVETSPEQFEDAFRLNVITPFALVQAALPHLLNREGANVVNVTSNVGQLAQRGFAVYGTVKAALSHLTRLLATDLAPAVRVNAVAPSVVETEGVTAALNDEMRRRILDATPLARLAQPQDVAMAVRWLASQAASCITGKVIALDGGAQGPTFPLDIPDVSRR